MFIPILVIFLSNFLAILGSLGKNNCLKYSFIILFLFIGLRYDYGNDTLDYLTRFQELSSSDLSIFNFVGIASLNSFEPGWIWLNYIFQPIGWFGFQLVLTAFEMWVIYDCTKRYVPTEFQWLSVAIFTCNQGFMWIGACSMLRQWLACVLYLYSIRFILNRKIIPFIFINLIGVLCHKSAIVVFPTYFFTFLNLDFLNKRTTAILVIILIAVWYSIAERYFGTMNEILMNFEDYSDYLHYDGSLNRSYSIIGFVAAFAMPVFTLLNIENIDKKFVPLIYISICALLVAPLAGNIMLTGRLAYYFSIINIVLYPIILSSFLNNRSDMRYLVYIMILIIILPEIRNLVSFFGSNNVFADHYSNYNTIIGQPWQ